jgi:hypothetical protein
MVRSSFFVIVLVIGFAPRPMGRWLPDEPISHEAGFNLDMADGRKILIEVHRYLFDPSRLPIDQDALWSRSVAWTLDGAPCRRLAPEDHFVHLVLHATVHRLMQVERTVTDLELLLRRGGIDLESALRTCICTILCRRRSSGRCCSTGRWTFCGWSEGIRRCSWCARVVDALEPGT